MTRHARRTLPALLTALVLLAGGALVATSAIQTLLGRTPVVDLATGLGALARTSWDSTPVLVAAGVAAVLGIVLLGAALLPGRTHVLPLAVGGAPVPADADGPVAAAPGVGVALGGWHRHDLAVRLRRRALALHGAHQARVRVRRRRVRVVVRTHRGATADLRAALETELGADLDALGLRTRPRLRVSVTSSRKER